MNLNLKDQNKLSKIIIVSEDVNFKNVLATKFRVDNFDIKLTNSGFHTLFFLENLLNIKVLIVNDNMRDMSGLEIIGLARSIAENSNISIIYVSRNIKLDEKDEYIAAGANEFVLQSTNYAPIVNAVERHIKQQNPPKELKKSA